MTTPDLILMNDYGGDWESYLDAVYGVFMSGVVRANLIFLGLPISCKFRPSHKGKHFSFWHLISTGKEEDERLPDFRRCERIRWIAYAISNAMDATKVSCWENKRQGGRGVVLWMEAHDYVVILSQRNGYFLLKTAYVTDREHTRRKFRKERDVSADPRKGWSRH